MSNEAVKVELTNQDGFPRRFTCASGVTIAKGTLLKLTSPRTASASTSSDDFICGIASMEKDGTDYSTSITAWTDGIFEMVASGAITAGEPVSSDAAENMAHGADTTLAGVASGAIIFGYALEDAIEGETINIRVRT